MKRQDFQRYHGDVVYEVWRLGGDVNAINDDRVEDHRWEGCSAEENAVREVRRQRARLHEPEEEENG